MSVALIPKVQAEERSTKSFVEIMQDQSALLRFDTFDAEAHSDDLVPAVFLGIDEGFVGQSDDILPREAL